MKLLPHFLPGLVKTGGGVGIVEGVKIQDNGLEFRRRSRNQLTLIRITPPKAESDATSAKAEIAAKA